MGKYISRKKTRKRKRKTRIRKRRRKTRIRKRRRKTSFRKRRRKPSFRKRRRKTRRYSGGGDGGDEAYENYKEALEAAGRMRSKEAVKAAVTALTNLLGEANIDLTEWGKDGKKTVADLLNEVMDGESKISVRHERGLVVVLRTTKVAVLKIFLTPAQQQVLHELTHKNEKKEVIKTRDSDTYLMEKMLPNETPYESIMRGIKEELDGGDKNGPYRAALRGPDGKGIIPVPIDPATNKICNVKVATWVDSENPECRTINSKTRCCKLDNRPGRSYPGLTTQYIYFVFGATIPNLQTKGLKNILTTEYKDSVNEDGVSAKKFKRYIEWGWKRAAKMSAPAAGWSTQAADEAAAASQRRPYVE